MDNRPWNGTGDDTKEWATDGGREGSWLALTWPAAQPINQIVFHDRPSANDRATGGTVVFSDGSSVAVGPLNNDGSATSITFGNRTVTSLRFNITSAEIEVYGR